MDTVILLYLIFINFASGLFVVIDKRRAKRRAYRISEALLWTLSVLGGAAVEFLFMIAVRHKTKHISFMLLLPLLSVVQTASLLLVLN